MQNHSKLSHKIFDQDHEQIIYCSDINAGLKDSDIGFQTITVTPNPTSVIGLADSDFGFTTTIVDSA